jgi:hypothetical protein
VKCAGVCLVLSLLALAGWVLHQFVLFQQGILEATDYLKLPPEMWSTFLFTLFLALGIESAVRWKRAG